MNPIQPGAGGVGRIMITGANRGLGRALVDVAASRGLSVHATMRDTTAFEAPSGDVTSARLDVTSSHPVDVPEDVGVIINNAGVDGAYLPVEHADVSELRHLIEVNLLGTVRVTQAAIPVLRRRGTGVICNVTSASLFAPMPFYSGYRASKAAVTAVCDSLRNELRPFGIRVLEVLPGPVRTDMLVASARLPEAAQFDGYEQAAQDAQNGRMAVEDLSVPALDAAEVILDAVLDPTSPTRITCDPIGRELFSAWQSNPMMTS